MLFRIVNLMCSPIILVEAIKMNLVTAGIPELIFFWAQLQINTHISDASHFNQATSLLLFLRNIFMSSKW